MPTAVPPKPLHHAPHHPNLYKPASIFLLNRTRRLLWKKSPLSPRHRPPQKPRGAAGVDYSALCHAALADYYPDSGVHVRGQKLQVCLVSETYSLVLWCSWNLATQQPASERIERTRPVEASPAAAPEAESQPRRRSSEQPPAKRPRNLSYSLFPAPIDRNLYLGDIPTKTTATAAASTELVAGPTPEPASEPAPAIQPAQQYMPQKIETHPSTTSTERGREATKNTATETPKKKRKRSPSPDVIPNPVGSSYGMDLDYFCYSSESEDEAEPVVPQTEPRKADSLGKTALRNLTQTERPASKKVRFDASPEDTPSKRRARATDPYSGTHFIGMGGPQASSVPATPTPQPTTPTPESRLIDPQQRPGFIPNRSGTFELDYDAFSDDSDSSGSESPSVPNPAADTTPPTSTQPDVPQRYCSMLEKPEDKIVTDFVVPNRLLPALLLALLHVLHRYYRLLRKPTPPWTRPVLKPRDTNQRRLVDFVLLAVIQAL